MWDLWPCNRLFLKPIAGNTAHGAGHLEREEAGSTGHHPVSTHPCGLCMCGQGVKWTCSKSCKIRITTLSLCPRVSQKTQNWEVILVSLAHLTCVHQYVHCTDFRKQSTWKSPILWNYLVLNHARKLSVIPLAEILQEMKRWSLPLRFGLCCLRVVAAVSEAHLIFLIFPFWASLPCRSILHIGSVCPNKLQCEKKSNFSFAWSHGLLLKCN